MKPLMIIAATGLMSGAVAAFAATASARFQVSAFVPRQCSTALISDSNGPVSAAPQFALNCTSATPVVVTTDRDAAPVASGSEATGSTTVVTVTF